MLRRARYDAVVVGGGVVGLAVARALQLGGLECCLLEAQEHLAASGASAGNTGIACTSPDAARGSLERTLLERAEALNLRAYEAHGVPHRAVGAAYAAWRDDEVPALRALYEAHGHTDGDGPVLPWQVLQLADGLWMACLVWPSCMYALARLL